LRTHGNPDREARAPRASSTRAPAIDRAFVGCRGPRLANVAGLGQALQLQRSAGNAAVARLLVGQRSRIAIQRNAQSAALLKTLATPRIGEGQAIEVQTHLMNGLETICNQKYGQMPETDRPVTLKLGGVLIDRLPNAGNTYMPTGGDTPEQKQQRRVDIQGLFGQLALGGRNPFAPAVFVNLDKNDFSGATIQDRIGAEVKGAGLGPAVVENTLKTMLDAGQFEYLRLAGFPNDEWKILVEMHYMRARPKDMAGFHKDTAGQSLFVNLNYHVPGHQLRGPEYVLNPPPSAEHDKQIGTPGREGTLPQEFLKDLHKTRTELPEPTWIESAGTVEGLGYVAFVDEAIHHATPWFGHRYVTATEFKAYLERKHPKQLKEIIKADTRYRAKEGKKKGDTERKSGKKSGGYSQIVSDEDRFSKEVSKKIIAMSEVENWRTWLAMIGGENGNSQVDPEARYTRREFEATMSADEFDLMLEDVGSQPSAQRQHGGAGGWYGASIPKVPGQTPSPVKERDKPPLKRRASMTEKSKDWPAHLPDPKVWPAQLPDEVPRRFIRSWVRAVPISEAKRVRDSQ